MPLETGCQKAEKDTTKMGKEACGRERHQIEYGFQHDEDDNPCEPLAGQG